MILKFRVEKVNHEFVIANINENRLKEEDILYKGFTNKDEAIAFLKSKYKIERCTDVSYKKYYLPEFRDIFFTKVICIDGVELTTDELVEKLKDIVGYIPYTLEHFRGRRKGKFYRHVNSIHSVLYYIDDYGNVTVNN